MAENEIQELNIPLPQLERVLHLFNMDEDEVEHIQGLMLRIGLHETNLTKALLRGDYSIAEKIIDETRDPDFLNDGALQATPLNIVLSGPSGPYQQPRNLRIAKLLLEKGGNPNLRIPNHDMESANESPLELLLCYYLRLIHVFGLPGTGVTSTPSRAEEIELIDSVGINGELKSLTPQTITTQTRELLYFCLERGGDPNLPTTEAARTIYHLAVVAPVVDQDLLQRMLELGANVNHADVHNTTPLMDIINLGVEKRSLEELERLEKNGRLPLLDIQNCSLQSTLFRAAFKGQGKVVMKLLDLGASPGLAARAAPRIRPRLLSTQYVKKLSGIPPLLSPLLGNSPCTSNLHVQIPRRSARYQEDPPEFQVSLSDHVIRTKISPLVDSGKFVDKSVTEKLFALTTYFTDHTRVANSKCVDANAVTHLLYGQTTAGLRQLAVRAILRHALFSSTPQMTVEKLNRVCEKRGFTWFRLMIPPSVISVSGAMLAHDFILETGNELELSFEAGRGENEGSRVGRDLDLEDEFQVDEDPRSSDELLDSEITEDPETFSNSEILSPSDPDSLSTEGRTLNPGVIDGISLNYSNLACGISAGASSLSAGASSFSALASSGLSRLASGISHAASDISSSARSGSVTMKESFSSGKNPECGRLDSPGLPEPDDSEDCFLDAETELDMLDRELVGLKFQAELDSFDRQCADWDRRFQSISSSVFEPQLKPASPIQPLDSSDSTPAVDPSVEALSEKIRRMRERMLAEHDSLDQDFVRLKLKERVSPDHDRDLGVHQEFLEETTEYLSGIRDWCEKNGMSSPDSKLSDVSVQPRSTDTGGEVRLRIDENWSLGTSRALEDSEVLNVPLEVEFSNLEGLDPSKRKERGDISVNHTEELVRTLNVVFGNPTISDPTVSRAERNVELSSLKNRTPVPPVSPDIHDPNEFHDTQNDLSTLDEPFDLNLVVPEASLSQEVPARRLESVTEEDEDEDGVYTTPDSTISDVVPELQESESDSDSDTWGGTFSLRHICCRKDSVDESLVTESTVVSRLNVRVLDALNDELGVPTSLRPCFSLEAAKLQISLLLFNHQSIVCDRNCEGDESDNDDEDDEDEDDEDFWETDEEVHHNAGRALSDSTRSIDRLSLESGSTSSSSGNLSVLSNFGSSHEDTDTVVRIPSRLSSWDSDSTRDGGRGEDGGRLSRSSDSDWLEDSDGMIRLRHFLAGPPPPDWEHSTSSDSDD